VANYTATRSMNIEACINGTHQFDYDNESGGPFDYSSSDPDGGESLSWSGGTGKLWHLEDDGATGYMIIGLLTGVAPTDGQTITGGTSGATCDVDGSVTATGPMLDGENLTINSSAIITCTQTPSILIGDVTGNNGQLFIDGQNISLGNMINFVGEYQESIRLNAGFTLVTDGDWFNVGTTDGTNSQVIDISSTGSDYWDSDFCIDAVPMIQVETGRRIDFDNASGDTPVVGDYVYQTADDTIMGRIVQVESAYIVVRFLTGSLSNDDAIEVRSLADDNGPNYRVTWTADVNNVSGDIKEAGIYQEFGNCRTNGTSYISGFHSGMGGFIFEYTYQGSSLTFGSATGGGFVPPTGCAVRIPNIHFSTSNTTQYALGNTYHDGSSTEGTWYGVNAIGIGELELSVTNVGITYFSCLNIFSIDLQYVGFCMNPNFSNIPGDLSIVHCVLTQDPVALARASATAFGVEYNPTGGQILDSMIITPLPQYDRLGSQNCQGLTMRRCIASVGNNSAGGTTYLFNCNYNLDCLYDDIVILGPSISSINNSLNINGNNNIIMKNFKIGTQDGVVSVDTDRLFFLISNINLYISGVDILNAITSRGTFIYLSRCSDSKIRCIGRFNDKINVGNVVSVCIRVTNGCSGIDIARVWFDNHPSNNPIDLGTNNTNILLQNVGTEYASEYEPASGDEVNYRGVHAASGSIGSSTGIVTSLSAHYGHQMHDGFRSDVLGFQACINYAPSSSVTDVTITSGTPVFQRDGTIDVSSGDVWEAEQSYIMLGHLAFTGDYTSTIGSGAWYSDEWTNITVDFQYDLGSGYNGSWLNARTATNLVSISGTHEFDIDNVSGTFNVGDDLSWGTGGTAGTGILSSVTGSHMDLILTSGVPPIDDLQITDDDTSATCDVNGAVTDSSVIVDGVKIKYRFTATADQNGLSTFIVDTVTTLDDQQDNLYPIDQDYVTVKVEAKDATDASDIQGARVYLLAGAGGDLTEGTVIFNDLTNASGYVQDTEFLYTNDQPVAGWIRRGTTPTYYKTSNIAGTINDTGLTITSFMVRD